MLIREILTISPTLKRYFRVALLVKFEGWPDKYNQWINEEDISEPQNLN
jgi:hypothetical protein